MEYYATLGMLCVGFIALFGFLNQLKRQIKEDREPLNDLNISITRLNANFENMLEHDQIRDRRIKKHGEQIDTIKEKQKENETKLEIHDLAIENCTKIIDRHEIEIGKIKERLK